MTFREHAKILQRNLAIVAAAFIVFAGIGYAFRDYVLAVLLHPLEGQQLSYLTPGGGFSFIFNVVMWCGIAGALPVLTLTLYRFVEPTLPRQASSRSVIVFVWSNILMIAGVLFGYLLAIPGAIHFLNEFAGGYVEAMLTAESYLNFVLLYTIGLGVLFQLPLIIVVVNWVKSLSLKKMLLFERWVILLAFIFAAILTPTPDIVNQLVVAVPVIVLYQAAVLIVWMTAKQARRRSVSMKSDTMPAVEVKHEIHSDQQLSRPTVAKRPAQAIDGFVGRSRSLTAKKPNNDTATAPMIQEKVPLASPAPGLLPKSQVQQGSLNHLDPRRPVVCM